VEDLNSIWQIGIVALLVGAIIGALTYRLFAPSVKQADKIRTELDATREELNSYKVSVNQHFNKTSELVNDLAQNYVKVYQHLAQGAQTLGDGKSFVSLLDQPQGRVALTVDDALNDAAQAADENLGDPAVTQANPEKTQATPAATVDEHAEAYTQLKSAEGAGHDAAIGEAARPAGDRDASSTVKEPVINVDALDEVAENAVVEAPDEAVSGVAETGEKTEARTTAVPLTFKLAPSDQYRVDSDPVVRRVIVPPAPVFRTG